jgi:acetyl-CoA synthetase
VQALDTLRQQQAKSLAYFDVFWVAAIQGRRGSMIAGGEVQGVKRLFAVQSVRTSDERIEFVEVQARKAPWRLNLVARRRGRIECVMTNTRKTTPLARDALSLASGATEQFRAARDRVLQTGASVEADILRPRLVEFNWALDWFDRVPNPEHRAVIVVGADGARSVGYGELTRASNRVANFLAAQGAAFGQRVLVVMRSSIEFYTVALACMKVGLPLVPVFSNLPRAELEDRIRRARIRHVVADADLLAGLSGVSPGGLRIAAGTPAVGWLPLAEAERCSDRFIPARKTKLDDPLLGYFTSGTTSRSKLAMHSQQSYTFGHLSSLLWQGIGRDDVHANVSAPGWAKHAWSSLFVPFSAEATALVFASDRPDPGACREALRHHGVTSFCAPPSYWRALVRGGLGAKPGALCQAVSAGEALDESVSAEVLRTWGLHIRDGYGQTEATAMLGFAPGQEIVPRGLGYALPGYSIKLVDPVTQQVGEEGEICLDLDERPVGLMLGYGDQADMPALPPGRYYRTGDLARRDERGCYHLLGRADDVFKSYDVRISPVELERTLRQHPLIADVAVFAVADALGEPVPAAACVAVDPNHVESLPGRLLQWQCEHVSAPQRAHRIWMIDQLPRTLSGKTNRAALRTRFSGAVPGEALDLTSTTEQES